MKEVLFELRKRTSFFVFRRRLCSAYYFSAGTSDHDWTTPDNDALWQDDLKTIFDPCPAGWRVPQAGKGDAWQALYSAAKIIVSGTWDATNKGALWTAPAVYGGSSWYPTSGLRNNSSGKFGNYGTRGLFWAVETGQASYYFNVVQNDTFLNRAVHAFGLSVRCVRE